MKSVEPAPACKPKAVGVPLRVLLLYSLGCGAAAGIAVAAIERATGASLSLSWISAIGGVLPGLLLAARRRRTSEDGG